MISRHRFPADGLRYRVIAFSPLFNRQGRDLVVDVFVPLLDAGRCLREFRLAQGAKAKRVKRPDLFLHAGGGCPGRDLMRRRLGKRHDQKLRWRVFFQGAFGLLCKIISLPGPWRAKDAKLAADLFLFDHPYITFYFINTSETKSAGLTPFL